MLCLPPHRGEDAGAAAGVIVEHDLLERARIELAVLRQLEGDLREPVGLLGRVQPEDVRLGLLRADDGVQHRGEREQVSGEEQRGQRQTRDVADLPHPPARLVAPAQPLEQPIHHGKAGHDHQAELRQDLVDVVEDVVAHLMGHHGLDLREGCAVQEVVVEGDALRPQEAAHVGADAPRLLGCVDLPDLAGPDPVGAREREDGSDHARILQLLWMIEDRRDQHRLDQGEEGREGDGHQRPPDPPAAREPSHHCVERHHREASQHDGDRETLQLLAHPGPETEVRETVAVLAQVVAIHRERKGRHRDRDRELLPVEPRLERPHLGGALRQVAHPGGEAGLEEEEEDSDAPEEAPEREPVPSFEVRVGAGALLRGYLFEVRAGRRRGIDGSGCAARRGWRRRKRHQAWRRGGERDSEKKGSHRPGVSTKLYGSSAAFDRSRRVPYLGWMHCLAAAGAATPQLGNLFPLWSVVPFVAMLLAIAVLPLLIGKHWEPNLNKAMLSALLGAPVAIWTATLEPAAVVHAGGEYLAFILLLGALFVISGGIVIRGTLAGTPGENAIVLGIGAVLASIIGTTGASMLLIRPLVRANSIRMRKAHVFVFFIFIVANGGGLLTPMGDPPLFLGFLRGVPFTWTLRLWPEWLFANGALLILFYIVDSTIFRREDLSRPGDLDQVAVEHQVPISIAGKHNFLFLAGVMGVLALGGTLDLPRIAQDAGIVLMIVLSWLTTPKALRAENGFSWHPIAEVAALFAGIFATMIPALAILNAHGAELGLQHPLQYFWASGALSSFLDNAPTYLTFASAASGAVGTNAEDLGQLLRTARGAALLAAISLGSVLMGANTNIGNGPNFMVKAIAEQAGVRMPGFFGYMGYSAAILIPLFIAVTWVFLL